MSISKPYNILIVDDHPIVRQGLSTLLDQQPGMKVCCEAGTAEEALEKLEHCAPDLALVDLSLNRMSGMELIGRLIAKRPQLRILVVSMHDERIYAERAIEAGAHGYIMKQEASDKLVRAARQILDGELYFSSNLSASLGHKANPAEPDATSPFSTLTTVEFEVFQLIAKGHSTTKISEHLRRSIKTIESHRANIRRKLGFNSSHELAHFAAQWQIKPGQ